MQINGSRPTPCLGSSELVADARKEKCENERKSQFSREGREDESDKAELEELDLGSDITPGSLFQLSFTRKRAPVQKLDEKRDDVDGTTSTLLRSDQVGASAAPRGSGACALLIFALFAFSSTV